MSERPQRSGQTRRGAWCGLSSGALLSVCALLPMLQVCEKSVLHPYESAATAWPHVLGLGVALTCGWLLRGRYLSAEAVRTLLSVLLGAVAFGGYVVIDEWVRALEGALDVVVLLLTAGAWIAVAALIAVSLPRSKAPPIRHTGRLIAITGLTCTVWYLSILGQVRAMEDLNDLLVGYWLSLAAAIAVVVSGKLLLDAAPSPAEA